MTATYGTEPATCAGVGHGYFECDHPGGCKGCRQLAVDIYDSEQFEWWATDLDDLDPKLAAARRATARNLDRQANARTY
jgi:hypothetical protein